MAMVSFLVPAMALLSNITLFGAVECGPKITPQAFGLGLRQHSCAVQRSQWYEGYA